MKKIFKSKLFLQVIVASIFATLATAGIVGAVTTIGANISTGGTLTATATSTLNGIIVDTTKFIVEDSSGNTSIGGTLGVTGATTLTGQLNFVNASSTGWLKAPSIKSDTGVISFDNDNLSTSGTLAAGNTVVTGILSASAKIGAASTTPTFQLGIGIGQATSTISMGKFCMYAEQENGTGVYLRLGSNQPANQPFATSTIPCNQ